MEHSVRAPAVGYRIQTGQFRLFYAPDVVKIHHHRAALAGAGLYVGEGATGTRPLIRKRGDAVIGHASIRDQLAGCGQEGVSWALFTHCGSEIVLGNEPQLREKVQTMGMKGVSKRILPTMDWKSKSSLYIKSLGRDASFLEM